MDMSIDKDTNTTEITEKSTDMDTNNDYFADISKDTDMDTNND